MKTNNTNNTLIKDTLKELFSFRTKKRRENIEDLKEFFSILNIEFSKTKIIHIAGTNGKGSTASYIENILIEANYKVCKFTSPHILKYNERIIFNKNMIEDEEIIENYNFIMKKIKEINFNRKEKLDFNFFEITFFMAMLYFSKKNPDFIILETGLGGRLDATNIINSTISVITNISLDHTNILGNTLQEIAYEKTGIIKNNQLCIYSQNLNELENEINKRTKNSINVIQKYKKLEITLDKKNFKTILKFGENNFIIPLFGKFQAYNFLLAFEISKIYNIDNKIIQKGLNNVYWGARFEIYKKNPTVILDAAHNDDSIKKLVENLEELYKKDEIIIITSLLETKDMKAVFSELSKITNKIFITSLKEIPFGQTSLEIKEKMISFNISIENIVFEDDIFLAYKMAEKLVNNCQYKAIVICGSFFEISKFKELRLN